jgi:hypothetical protein
MADFHTTALAVPLLLLAVERYAAGRPAVAAGCAILAVTAREDVALAVAGLGLWAALRGNPRSGTALCTFGALWALGSGLGVISYFAGGANPFISRYQGVLRGPEGMAQLVSRPEVGEYVAILLLNGGWLGILAPLALAPALPALALNVFSASPWMASGKGHYSALVLPFLVASAAAGLGWLRYRIEIWQGERDAALPGRVVQAAAIGLILSSVAAYARGGVGPLAVYASPVLIEPHADLAAGFAAEIPGHASVSATATLFPRVSRRERIYVFPAIGDAEYVFLDVTASSAPTSPDDVFLHVQRLLSEGGWSILRAEDGLLLLRRQPGEPAGGIDQVPSSFYSFTRLSARRGGAGHRAPEPPLQRFLDGALDLVAAEYRPQPAGALSPGEPRGTLRTTWRANRPLAMEETPIFAIEIAGRGTERHSEVAALAWHPPPRWTPGELVQIEVLHVPVGGRWWVHFDAGQQSRSL